VKKTDYTVRYEQNTITSTIDTFAEAGRFIPFVSSDPEGKIERKTIREGSIMLQEKQLVFNFR
jgi:hypothetical protein